LSDWYAISRREVEQVGGKSLFRPGVTLQGLLKEAYPSFTWHPSGFALAGRAPQRYWRQISHQKEFLDRISSELGVKEV